jgi:hypothetical protein
VRPVIFTNSGTDTIRIDAKPKIALSALARSEASLVTTLASGGLLVQLTGQYSIVKDLQNSPVNTTASRTVTADRVLVHSQAALMLAWTKSAGDSLLSQIISNPGRLILSGDFLEFDVYIDPANPAPTGGFSDGGMVFVNTDTSASDVLGTTDQNGYDMSQPATGMDALARGVWYSRKCSLATSVGKTCNSLRLVEGSDGAGDYKVLYRNIRFTDGAGTVRQSVWTSGEPSLNTNGVVANASNVRCGPSNSYLLYAFNASGSQVAQDVRTSFDGI